MPRRLPFHLHQQPAKSFDNRAEESERNHKAKPHTQTARMEAKELVAVRRWPKQSCAMKRTFCFALAPLSALALCMAASGQPTPEDRALRNDRMLADYFRTETAAIAGHCLADIHSLEDWQARRGEYRRQLQEMLGLWPMPERTDLKPVITGKLEQADFTVEKLYFQALPKLYVTANLYLPKKLDRAGAGDSLRVRPQPGDHKRGQLRQQGRLPASRRMVRPQRLCLPDD